MKIDTDLRQAVRSACNAQPDNGWERRKELTITAIAELTSKKRYREKVQKARHIITTCRKAIVDAEAVLTPLGVSADLERINDDEAFTKAGGVIPESAKRWDFDKVMAELAAAKPSDREKILLRYGIRWE